MVFRQGLISKYRFAFLAIAFATLVLFPSPKLNAQVITTSPVPLPVPFTPVVDNANVIDPGTRQRLEAIYKNLKERADIEFAVVTVPTTGDRDIYEYSLNIARGWGIGSKEGDKNGLLLVVAVSDRKYFTQVSRHLEGDLNDGLVGQIQRERLVPQFRRGNYSQGIYDTIETYVATLAEKRGFSIDGIDQRKAYRPPRNQPTQPAKGFTPSSMCALVVIVGVIILLLSIRGGGNRGCLSWLLLGSLLNSGGRGSNSGWIGGGFGGSGGGGWGGGGGGGFGGGFGGGGDFGGGGAGGSW